LSAARALYRNRSIRALVPLRAREGLMRLIAITAVLGVILLAAGCAPQRAAPVDDRRPSPTAQPRLPVLQPTPVPGAAPGTYVVKRGDTLYSIALEHGADYRELAQSNNIDDPPRSASARNCALPRRLIVPPPRSAIRACRVPSKSGRLGHDCAVGGDAGGWRDNRTQGLAAALFRAERCHAVEIRGSTGGKA